MSSAKTGEVVLGVEGVAKEYTDGERVLRVLTRANLGVRRGEMLAVTGKSGTGKSTLLHIMGLIDSPTEGAVSFMGRDCARLSPAERARVRNRSFGFVFQSYHLVPELSALENVLLPAMMTGVGEWLRVSGSRRARAAGLLRDVGLEERASHRPSRLSGGERQRVAIARALVNEPEIVFCDEPTGNLDEETSGAIHELLRTLNSGRGVTVVVVTHDRELAKLADRVVRLEGGRVIQEPA